MIQYNRSTVDNQLDKSSVKVQQLLKITGHNNQNFIESSSIFNQEHHNKIMNIIRGNSSSIVENSN